MPERPEVQKAQVVETVTRDMTAFNPPKDMPPKVTPLPIPAPNKPRQTRPNCHPSASSLTLRAPTKTEIL